MFMLMGIAFAIWVLPETFGKSLEEMVGKNCGDEILLTHSQGSGVRFGRRPSGYGADGAHFGVLEE